MQVLCKLALLLILAQSPFLCFSLMQRICRRIKRLFWLTGIIVLSGIDVKRISKANIRISTSVIDSAVNAPLTLCKKTFFLVDSDWTDICTPMNYFIINTYDCASPFMRKSCSVIFLLILLMFVIYWFYVKSLPYSIE